MENKQDKHALVVEGGGMRGIFSAGVLDKFIDRKYRPFDFCIGVSAGSTNLAAWLSDQRGRNYTVYTDYSCRPQFISFPRYLTGGHWFDLDWLWEITIKEIPLNLDNFSKQVIPLYVVTTDIRTGKAEYIPADTDNMIELIKASCSIPGLYRSYPVVNGMMMTDGGVADPIPVQRAYSMGAREITVILSRPEGYRKSSKPGFMFNAFSDKPELKKAMILRADNYNRAIDFIKNPPSGCRIHTITPPENFPVGRMTTKKKILESGYNMGLKAAESLIM